MKPALFAVVVFVLAQPAQGQCVWNEPPESAQAASVVGSGPRIHFVSDASAGQGCPSSAAMCQARGYLVPGDVVMTTATQGAFTCAMFTSPAGATTLGWLPSAALSPLGEAPAGLGWAGHWHQTEGDIVIRPAGAALRVSGDATWGAGDPDRVRRGGVNIGEIQGTAAPVNGVLAFTVGAHGTVPYDRGDETDCRVRMRLLGPYLVVADNHNCGGMNVTFSGAYRRR